MNTANLVSWKFVSSDGISVYSSILTANSSNFEPFECVPDWFSALFSKQTAAFTPS